MKITPKIEKQIHETIENNFDLKVNETMKTISASGSGAILTFYKNTKTGQDKIVKSVKVNQKSEREYDMIQALKKRNIQYLLVPDVIKANKFIHVIMDRLDGDLSDFLDKFNKNDINKIIKQLIVSVIHMHENGIIHNDLKLENVFVDFKKKRVYIADYDCSGLFSDPINYPKLPLCSTSSWSREEAIWNQSFDNKIKLSKFRK
jgi:serine/threonine protein kinase